MPPAEDLLEARDISVPASTDSPITAYRLGRHDPATGTPRVLSDTTVTRAACTSGMTPTLPGQGFQ